MQEASTVSMDLEAGEREEFTVIMDLEAGEREEFTVSMDLEAGEPSTVSMELEAGEREECVIMAKFAEQAERYEDMMQFMVKVAKDASRQELTVEERNLLSVAFKNVIGRKRASARVICFVERKEESEGNTDHIAATRQFRYKVEGEMSDVCDRIVHLLESYVIPSSTTAESKVFLLKMKGDYLRYLAELQSLDSLRLWPLQRRDVVESALSSYQSAQLIAASLAPTHPLRLGLALNFSVFYFHILDAPLQAFALTRQALREAAMSDTPDRTSADVMELLRGNLALWTDEIWTLSRERLLESRAYLL